MVAAVCSSLIMMVPVLSIGFFFVRGSQRQTFERLPPRRTFPFGGETWAVPSPRGRLVLAAVPAAFVVFWMVMCASLVGLSSLAEALLGDPWYGTAIAADALFAAIWLVPSVFVAWLLSLPSVRRPHARRLHFTQTHLALDEVAVTFQMTERDVAQPLSSRPVFRVAWEDVGEVAEWG
ncbi:MAG: hypothetical protein AAF211_32050, partial [Myxococcota bacterium]